MSSTNTLTSKKQKKDWLDLPSDVTANILKRIGVVDILENAQKVCTAWRKICKDDPAMWRVIKIFWDHKRRIWKQAVDRSQGQLVDLTIVVNYYYDYELLPYVADRSRCLRRLELAFSHVKVRFRRLHDGLLKFPLLEELNLYLVAISREDIVTAGRYCPMLKTLKVNQKACKGKHRLYRDDRNVAIAIGENLRELRHLELIGSSMSNEELRVILDGCRHLETLDLRNCLSIDLNGDLGKRCFEHIKHLKLPNDSLDDCPYPLKDKYNARPALSIKKLSTRFRPSKV